MTTTTNYQINFTDAEARTVLSALEEQYDRLIAERNDADEHCDKARREGLEQKISDVRPLRNGIAKLFGCFYMGRDA